MRSKQHLNYKYKCFNGCRAVSDVRQKWNTGQSWGCCWNNFWGLKAKTDRRGVKLHPVWKQDSLYWYPLELSEDTALLCRGLIPSAPVMQWPVHACSNISALPGSDFFLLRLSPAQLACMSLRTEKARSNLSCECVFAESRGGLDTSERSGCEITAEARKEQKYWSILLVCVYFFFPFSVMFWVVCLLWTSRNYWAESMWDVWRFEGRWWRGLSSSVLEPDDSTACGLVFNTVFLIPQPQWCGAGWCWFCQDQPNQC